MSTDPCGWETLTKQLDIELNRNVTTILFLNDKNLNLKFYGNFVRAGSKRRIESVECQKIRALICLMLVGGECLMLGEGECLMLGEGECLMLGGGWLFS